MALLFGIFDHMDQSGGPLGRQYEERLKLIEAYDAGGFHAYHLAEHHGTPLGRAPSPSVFLAAVAQRTRRLRFGALVHTLSLYHPLRLAEEICMLDQMSGGRVELGIGRGISPHELAYYGVAPAEAPAIYLEASEVLLRALTAERSSARVTFHGMHFRFDDVPFEMTPVQQPHPPLWCGTGSPEGVGWFARNDVSIVMNGPVGRVRAITDRYREEFAKADRHRSALPFLGMARHVIVTEREAEVIGAARAAYDKWRASFMLLWDRHGTTPPNVVLPESFDDFVRSGFCLIGEPDKVRRSVEAQAKEAGINYFVCRFAFGNLPYEVSRQSLDLFVREVMPRIEPRIDEA